MKKKALLLSLLLSPFLLIAFFNHPSLDDYWNANTIISHGRLKAVAYSFNHFSGRYFSTFLMSMLNTLPQGKIWIFKLFPVLICLGTTAALYYFIKTTFIPGNKWRTLTVALILTLLHILNMRVLFEGLYWMSATITYQVAIIIYIVLLTMISSYVNRKSLATLTGIFILIICLCGTFESIESLFLAGLLFLFFKFRREKKSRNYPFVISCFILNIICSSFVLFSNGTRSRINNDFNQFHVSIAHASFRAFESVGYYYSIWLLSPYNILGILIIISYIRSSSLPGISAFSGRRPIQTAIWTISISILVSLLVYLPHLYLESEVPIPRITSVVFMAFCFTVAGVLLTMPGHLAGLAEALRPAHRKNLLWIAFIISVVFSNNFRKVSSDLFGGTAFKFNAEQNKRYSDLRNCHEDTCYVDRIKHWPTSIEQGLAEKDVPNPLLYWNTYFHKKEIIIK